MEQTLNLLSETTFEQKMLEQNAVLTAIAAKAMSGYETGDIIAVSNVTDEGDNYRVLRVVKG